MAEVTAEDRKEAGFSDGKFPVRNAAQAKSAIKLRHNSKDHSAAEVLAHVLTECRKLVKQGRMSPGAMRQIEKRVLLARQRDKTREAK